MHFIENRYRIDGLFQVYVSGYFEYIRKRHGTYDSLYLGLDKASDPLIVTIDKKQYFLSSEMQNTLRVLLFVLLVDTSCVNAMCKLPTHIKVVFEQITLLDAVPECILLLDKALKKTPDLRINGDYNHDTK